MSEWLHHGAHGQVTAFGASPDDDAADDTAAFAAALAACMGGTVVVPAGRYRLDGTVQLGNSSINPARNRTCDGSAAPWAICPSPPASVHLSLEHGARRRGQRACSLLRSIYFDAKFSLCIRFSSLWVSRSFIGIRTCMGGSRSINGAEKCAENDGATLAQARSCAGSPRTRRRSAPWSPSRSTAAG